MSYIHGWRNLPPYQSAGKVDTTVSVIIPFRNEAGNISSLMQSLKCQDFTPGRWNIFFVDDHSTDESCRFLNAEMKDFKNAELLRLPPDKFGKRAALEYGARRSDAELLLFTDADCLPCKTWITSIVRCYKKDLPVLISAPVIMEPGKSFISKFQALEFMSLFAAGAASFGNRDPILTNGANLAIPRDLYLENLPSMNNAITSGDDIFILLNLKKTYPRKLAFLKSRDAVVKIFPMPDLRSFLSQRIRWTSKARYYKDRSIIITAILVFMVNFLLLATLIYGLFVPGVLILWGIMFLFKSAIDYAFLRLVTDFTGQRNILKYFAISQLVYFLYVGFIGIIGNFTSYKWKGRKINI